MIRGYSRALRGGAVPTALVAWALIFALVDPIPLSIALLAIVVVTVPFGTAFGLRAEARPWMTLAERVYARAVGAVVGVPVALALGIVGVAILGVVTGQMPNPDERFYIVYAVGVVLGATLGPWCSSALIFGRWRWLLPTWPLVSIMLFYLTVVAARVSIGQWPSYGAPDAGVLDVSQPWIAGANVAATVALGLTLFSPLTLIFLVPWGFRLTPEGRRARVSSAIFSASYVCWMALMSVDPGGYRDWLLD